MSLQDLVARAWPGLPVELTVRGRGTFTFLTLAQRGRYRVWYTFGRY